MAVKDSSRDQKEVDKSASQHMGEDHARSTSKALVFPGSKQVKHVVAGGVAGAVSRTCVSPLERVKILLQVNL